MATWAGFSDAEVTKLKSSIKPKDKEQQKFTGQTDSVNTSLTVGFSDPEVTSDKPKNLPVEKTTLSKQTEDVNTSLPTEDFTTSENCVQLEVNKSDCTTLENDIIKEELSDQEDDIFSNRHQASLDEMHRQQEEVKKENLKRKMVLQQALKNRYKESSREVETLKIVQQELTKLDNLVTEDVAILRNKIEETDKLYNSARKRFEEAEKEYVSSKLLLHEIKEKKELLSEHLYTIIQNNESRKAQKLTQLMSTLHIEDNIDDNVLTHSSHIEGRVTSGNSQRVLPVDNIPLGASMISIQRLD